MQQMQPPFRTTENLLLLHAAGGSCWLVLRSSSYAFDREAPAKMAEDICDESA
eukprot:CAMPEP_0195015490 /NCGR_PEP_ID=MMETSP0326_2-20130528/19950_1 /TAXON_ID=2866 ORGANISM="Crypthecodinium cohnii, Strain Seligo" /NCGR_SAMPLE_ID=MMETSP0326_2 /ASSEMBLY_ACC=CAM_ASM_000348 /LENGTH=52 /DNA_ID=CAMNT_0040029837 /DNA_START=1 /DNA_END=156 /DNA_ORIENTATION=+